MVSRPLLACGLGLVLAATSSALAIEPTPGPAATPGSLEQMPGASQKDVTRLLRKVRRRYGEEAVVMQAQLLMRALGAGAQRGVGVRVEGVEYFRSVPYLRFDLETGIVFDDETRDSTARIQVLWGTIVEPALVALNSNGAGPNGIAVDAVSHHRPYRTAAGRMDTSTQASAVERITFYVDPEALRALHDGDVSGHGLLARAIVTVDGRERSAPIPMSDWPTSPGPGPDDS